MAMSKLVLALSSLVIAPAAAEAAICGSLAAVKGQVMVLRIKTDAAKAAEQVRHGIVGANFMPVQCDDVIETGAGGSAKIILGSDRVTLAPDSRVVIAAHSGTQAKPKVDLLNLTYGKMRGLIQKRPNVGQNGSGAFRVKTFSAIAGVRGTDLYVGYNPNLGVTEQAVIEGKVEVTQTGTKQSVMVEGGYQVAVEISPDALTAARVEAKAEKSDSKDAKLPEKAASDVKPLKVFPIQESVKQSMRVASLIVKDDKEFTSEPAVKILGPSKTWVIEKEDVPSNLKDVDNEF